MASAMVYFLSAAARASRCGSIQRRGRLKPPTPKTAFASATFDSPSHKNGTSAPGGHGFSHSTELMIKSVAFSSNRCFKGSPFLPGRTAEEGILSRMQICFCGTVAVCSCRKILNCISKRKELKGFLCCSITAEIVLNRIEWILPVWIGLSSDSKR